MGESHPGPRPSFIMRNIFLDIETTALPSSQREFLRPSADDVALGNTKDPAKVQAKIAEAVASWERGDDAALDPLQARVALIGYAIEDGPVQHLADDDEATILTDFWRIAAPRGYDADVRLVGHCLRFDAAMLVHRSWLHGVIVPPSLLLDLYQYAPRHWLDTATRWTLGDRKAAYRKLKHLCAAFGIPAKDSPIDGASFGEWWTRDRSACLAYNAQDVEAVRALWQRIGGDFNQSLAN